MMPTLPPPSTDRSILIVDDDDNCRSAVASHLSTRGMTVSYAGTCELALGLLQGQRFDLVLTGVHVPRMGGIELARRIRDRMPGQAVIVLTSSHDVSDCIGAMRAQVDDYLLKPVDMQELDSRISLVFLKHQTRRQDRNYRFQLVGKVLEQEKKLERNLLQSVRSLIHAIEARDPYTKGHSFRVTRLVEGLLRSLGAETVFFENVALASQLHDAGKLGIADTILRKACGLSQDEFFIMRTHPEVGYHILEPILPETCLDGILHHHERWDGKGYPMNLSGEKIPLAARIICIADSFDAMVTDRTYRKALPAETAILEIERGSGRQFDPRLVPRFVEIVSEGLLPAIYEEMVS